MNKLSILQEKIGYEFKNPEYLKTALTHKSSGDNHYEKLEFLGDSIINFCISSIIFQEHNHLDEGKLSILRAKLVSKPSLSRVGKDFNIDPCIKLKNQKVSDSIRADVVEAVIGAVYLDSDIYTCKKLIKQHCFDSIQFWANQNLKDPKSYLQELAHQMGIAHPHYQILEQQGKSHDSTYIVLCTINDLSTQGQAKTKRYAEKLAAENMIKKLKEPCYE